MNKKNEELQEKRELLIDSLKGWLLDSEIKLLVRVSRAKKLSKSVQRNLINKLLENDLTVREIKLLLGVGGEKVLKAKAELERKKVSAQEELELKTNQEVAKANALIEFNENRQEILQVVQEANKTVDKVQDLEALVSKLELQIANNMVKEEKLRSQIYDFIGNELPRLTEGDRVDLVQKLVTVFLLGKK